MTVYFISDLHLSQETPQLIASFEAFLQSLDENTEALYILGDLFEVWFGDDGILPAYQSVISAIKCTTERNIPVYFMRGNRDFLIGERFTDLTGCKLLDDPHTINLYGRPTLLMHGDLLCTDDISYMAFREQVRNPQWQEQFLSLPIEQRIEVAKQARQQSKEQMQDKTMEIMDANENAIQQTMQTYKVNRLIHGHTHRPAIHHMNDDQMQRIVLGDWHDQASYLRVSADKIELVDPRVTTQISS